MSTDNIDHATKGKDDNGNSTVPFDQIIINEVYQKDGKPKPDSHLLGCFFSPEGSNGEYFFFGEKGKELHGHLASGQKFRVEHAGDIWELTVNFCAYGTWARVVPGHAKEVEETGTYTAQAGGGSDVPAGKSASA